MAQRELGEKVTSGAIGEMAMESVAQNTVPVLLVSILPVGYYDSASASPRTFEDAKTERVAYRGGVFTHP